MIPEQPMDNKSTNGINPNAPEFAGSEQQQQQHNQTIGPEPMDHSGGSNGNIASPLGGYAAPSIVNNATYGHEVWGCPTILLHCITLPESEYINIYNTSST